MDRGDLTEEQWVVVGLLLLSERGRKARPAQDNRRFLNCMLHVLRVGCPWRDVHERYGKLVDLGLTDDWQHMIESTVVRSHSQAAGAKGGPARRALAEAAAALRARSTPARA